MEMHVSLNLGVNLFEVDATIRTKFSLVHWLVPFQQQKHPETNQPEFVLPPLLRFDFVEGQSHGELKTNQQTGNDKQRYTS